MRTRDFTIIFLIFQILKFSQKIDIIYIEKKKENCVMENKYKLYDSVVSTIMSNVMVECARCGKILLYDFKPELDMDKLYFNVAAIVADMSKEKLYLHMPFWDYVRFRMKFWKKRTNLKWFSPWAEKKLKEEYKTSVDMIMFFVSEQLDVLIDLFKEINDEYYGWVD